MFSGSLFGGVSERFVGVGRRASLALILAALVVPMTGAPVHAAVNLQLVQGGFDAPIYLTHAGDDRLFVVEKAGKIKIVGVEDPFLDITGRIDDEGERGLLGLAFHPNYASNGLFFVFYTRNSDGDVIIAEFERSAGDPNDADESSERVLLRIDHPYTNHNGGWMGFKGDYLWVATGDGGNTPQTAQNLNSLKGKILRFDPLDPDGAGPDDYTVPGNNPYVGRSGNDLVWAYGLRNPWRCSHDRLNGKLWCGDVGQGRREEINRSKTGKGLNFGWDKVEGTLNYPSGTTCTTKCKQLPILDIPHEPSNGDAVAGGYVSRRSGAALEGQYVFGEYGTGRIWIIPANFPAGGALPAPDADTSHGIVSFGEDEDGRLYLVDIAGGIYSLTDS